MTTEQCRHPGLIVLIRWGILGDALLSDIDLSCASHLSWHRPRIASRWKADKFLMRCRLLIVSDSADESNIDEVTASCPVAKCVRKCKVQGVMYT